MALSADRYLDQSQQGRRFSVPAHSADTYHKGAACIFNAGRVSLQAGAAGVFAGFVDQRTVAAVGDRIPLRRPEAVWLPDSAAAFAHRGQIADLITDDEALAYRARGAAITANGTPLGLVLDVVDGESVLVEVGTDTGAD